MSADGMLYLLKAEPTLLPAAPSDAGSSHITHRTEDEIHTCLRCGETAHIALIADTHLGNRWLDLCHECYHWLRTTTTDQPRP